MAEVNNSELEGVSGGAGFVQAMQPFVPYTCQLTGFYWGTTFMDGGPYDALIGQYMQVVYNNGAQGPCKYQLMRDGAYMGWTVGTNFRLL